MNQFESRSSLVATAWEGPAAAGVKSRSFKYVAEGTTVATGCVKTKEGDMSEYNATVKRHWDLAMSTRR